MATFGTPTDNATASLGNGQTLKWREFEYLSGTTTIVGYENEPTVKASFNFDNKYDKSYFNHNVTISKGIARYTSNFEPPTKQFGRPDLKIKDTYGSYNIKLKQIN